MSDETQERIAQIRERLATCAAQHFHTRLLADCEWLLSLVDSQGEALRAAKQDTERLNWSVRRSAMLFRRETPEPEVMVAFYPLAQDGFLAAEYEGRDVPVNTPSVRLADFGGDVNTAFRHLIDEARSASPRVSTEGR